ncbi:MAG: AAA family ATPase [Lachnospiraceae bacterium]|nr:AAA family ATPase [Lachnospiraceae bacterium]
MRPEDYQALKERLETALDEKKTGTFIAAIDGRCGSGKSTVAAALQQAFGHRCNVVHMDDFYLPMEDRPADWKHIPSANMDLDRFRREVLLPVREGQEAVYDILRLHEGIRERQTLPLRPLLLVEGSYCQHTSLRDLYDLRVFLDCPPGEQEQRIRERAPERFEGFRTLWIPLELAYHENCQVREHADLVIDTAGPWRADLQTAGGPAKDGAQTE